jgi:cytochrome b involved in lipid metabolism
MNKIIAIIAAIIVIGGGVLLLTRGSSAPSSGTSLPAGMQGAPSESANPVGASQTATSTATAPASTAYTLADVAKHNDASSCWSAINGSVYDLTNWIGEHPGGPQRILSICGTDGSSAFNAQHGSPSDTRPKQMLATMRIGSLAQ